MQRQWLNELGKPTYITNKTDTIIAYGRVNHYRSDNPPADRYINKCLLKKDINERECELDMTIYYHDSLAYREPEFWKIINQFPD